MNRIIDNIMMALIYSAIALLMAGLILAVVSATGTASSNTQTIEPTPPGNSRIPNDRQQPHPQRPAEPQIKAV